MYVMHYSKVLIQFAALMIRIGDESDYLVCKPSTNWICKRTHEQQITQARGRAQ